MAFFGYVATCTHFKLHNIAHIAYFEVVLINNFVLLMC